MNTVIIDKKEVSPSKVVCIGRNYVDHIKELDNEVPTSMVLFMKPNSAISMKLTNKQQTPLHYEGELSFMLIDGKIKAVAFGLDLTNRTLQNELKVKGLPWERAKAFDGAAVFGEFVSIEEVDIEELSLELWINGVLVQEGNTGLMIHKPNEVIAEINSFSTLCTYDIVMSGTPKGVGGFLKGDRFIGKVFLRGKEISVTEWIAQ